MGYFSNGSEGMDYEAKWCDRCVHQGRCAVWLAHNLRNYKECNDKESILHILIPRNKDGGNGKCEMFWEGKSPVIEQEQLEQEQRMKTLTMKDTILPDMKEWAKARGIL